MSAVAILTSGGDSPGMNAVLFAFAAAAKLNNVPVIFVENGYEGLIKDQFKTIKLMDLQKSVFNAGSVIGSARSLEFKNNKEARLLAVDNLKKHGVKVLVVVGGNGSFQGAEQIFNLNFPVIGVPATIDNDVGSTCYTVGFFSALDEIFNAVRKIKFTSDSHNQVVFVEAMGRDCSDLSIFAGITGCVDYIITHENPKTCSELVDIIRSMKNNHGKKGIVFLVSEKIYGSDFGFNLPSLTEVSKQLEKLLDISVRTNVLGYLQRGAFPTSWEIFVAQSFGTKAFEQIKNKNLNVAVGYDGLNFYYTNIVEANNIEKESQIDRANNHNKLFKIIKH